jgi:hypothetical protein
MPHGIMFFEKTRCTGILDKKPATISILFDAADLVEMALRREPLPTPTDGFSVFFQIALEKESTKQLSARAKEVAGREGFSIVSDAALTSLVDDVQLVGNKLTLKSRGKTVEFSCVELRQ